MAIGDDAAEAGYPLVPGTGEDGKVKYGAREINRTRDFVAQVSQRYPERITVSASAPATPSVGDLWVKVV